MSRLNWRKYPARHFFPVSIFIAYLHEYNRRTPHQYLTFIRLQEAKVLLEKEGISITEVCNNVGFESLGSFSTLFKKQLGYAPQYYRNIAYLKKKLAKEQPKSFIPHCFIDSYKLDK